MRIIKTRSAPESAKSGEYHILTFAETGFAMLNLYGESFGIDRDAIENFSRQSNRADESGSLYPKAPISIVPRRYVRDLNDANQLANQIIEFLKANQKTIHAKKILFDFRAGVDKFVIEACEHALKSPYANGIDEAVIIDEN
ncbi:hypothetical protein [Nitrosomonas sp. Is37]|uniref:hypothetical protein n=1 Tax=Nitrosomonas sp. Is37 TaxID=3080535 RepID=UPI00294AF725|nr:hypothetical protein [Nitrosomonas sp. Is37]MDV6345037.1 hypothetical protein [Nitrosomonas sp. Is37]